MCHGDIAPRKAVFGDGRAAAFIDWDGIFVSTPMWDLAHAVCQCAPVCDDADPCLDTWPNLPYRSARIAALVGGCRRSVVRKIAAGIPASTQMEREGILDALDSQHRAAEQLRPLVAHAAAAARPSSARCSG